MTTMTLAKYVTAVGGAILVVAQLLSHMDAAYMEHLDRTFATKADFQRLEEKLDQVVDRLPAPKKR